MSYERYLAQTFRDDLKALRISDGSLLSGVVYDKFTLNFPTSTTERYDYYLDGNIVAQVLLTYTTSSKNTLISAERL